MIFREVLRPPIWVLAFIYFLLLSIVLSVWAAFDTRATLITLAISTLALIWIAIAMKSEITFDGNILRIDQANNWEDFREACSYSHIPGENMIWADKKGNITSFSFCH